MGGVRGSSLSAPPSSAASSGLLWGVRVVDVAAVALGADDEAVEDVELVEETEDAFGCFPWC